MVYQAVIFDMDGLLVGSEVLIESVWRQALREKGFELSHELFIPLVGVATSVIGQAFHRYYGIDEQVFENLYRRRSELLLDLIETEMTLAYLKAGATDMLDLLEHGGVPKAVATTTRRTVVEKMLQRLGIDQRFEVVVGGDEVSLPKPNPDIFIEAARRLGTQPGSCIVLEDSSAGIEADHRAGMLPILVPDLLLPPPEVVALAYAQFESLVAAREVMATLLKIARVQSGF
jgi:HAD superfamily hydrolase (TIGR01509 family)